MSQAHSSFGFPAFNLLPKASPYLVQVVGEVDDPEVLSMINDMGYLLNDTRLPMDDGQVQWPGGWRVRLCSHKPSHPEQQHLPPKLHTNALSFTEAP